MTVGWLLWKRPTGHIDHLRRSVKAFENAHQMSLGTSRSFTTSLGSPALVRPLRSTSTTTESFRTSFTVNDNLVSGFSQTWPFLMSGKDRAPLLGESVVL